MTAAWLQGLEEEGGPPPPPTSQLPRVLPGKGTASAQAQAQQSRAFGRVPAPAWSEAWLYFGGCREGRGLLSGGTSSVALGAPSVPSLLCPRGGRPPQESAPGRRIRAGFWVPSQRCDSGRSLSQGGRHLSGLPSPGTADSALSAWGTWGGPAWGASGSAPRPRGHPAQLCPPCWRRGRPQLSSPCL